MIHGVAFTVLIYSLCLPDVAFGKKVLVKKVPKPPIDAEKSLIWGPGIKNFVNLPVNYVYIQAVHPNGSNFTTHPGQKTLKVFVDQGEEDIMKVKDDFNYVGDGKYLYRFRLHNSYEAMALTVQTKKNGTFVADSPYMVDFALSDNCNCPRPFDEWAKTMQCSEVEPQIEEDLKMFPKIDLEDFRSNVFKKHKRSSLVHYTIMKNKLYRRTVGQMADFKEFSDEMLLSVLRKVKIPDMEFVVNLGDYPLEENERPVKNDIGTVYPILSWCGSEDSHDIVWPTHDLSRSTLGAMEKVTVDIMSIQGFSSTEWSRKEPKVFFRGRDSNQARLDVVEKYHKHKEFDVALTHFFFHEYNYTLYGEKQQPMSMFDFFKNKYILNIDGTVAAYRMPYLLAGHSLVFKQDSPYYEHFYKKLVPWTHYVPVKRDMSDILDQLEWAKEHDEEAQQITKNAHQFVMDHLMPEHTYCYVARLLKEYAKRQVGRPVKHQHMTQLNQPNKSCRPCKEMRLHLKSGQHDEL